MHWVREGLYRLNEIVLLYFLFLNTWYALLLALSIPELWSHWHLATDDDRQRLLSLDVLPPLSIIVPCYNESMSIVVSVTNFLTLEYPQYEVIVVNDGSTDDTFEIAKEVFELYETPAAFRNQVATQQIKGYYRSRIHSKLIFIDKKNGGKADGLNAGLSASRFPYIIALDADTLIEPDALLRLGRPFLLGQSVAAVGGTIRVVNGCTVSEGRISKTAVDGRIVPGIQTVEYLRAFLFGRLGWNRLGGNLIISGAFGLFKKAYVEAVGGYMAESITEDIDLVLRIRRYMAEHGIKDIIHFLPDPVAWTEVPNGARVLSGQRERWHRGLIYTLWDHRTMLFNPKYGRAGVLAMPFYLFGEMLAPVIEFVGYISMGVAMFLGVVDYQFAGLFLVSSLGLGFFLSLWAIVLEESTFRRYPAVRDFRRLLFCAMVEPFGYRQLTVWYRLQAFVNVILDKKKGWGEMPREGFKKREVGDVD